MEGNHNNKLFYIIACLFVAVISFVVGISLTKNIHGENSVSGKEVSRKEIPGKEFLDESGSNSFTEPDNSSEEEFNFSREYLDKLIAIQQEKLKTFNLMRAEIKERIDKAVEENNRKYKEQEERFKEQEKLFKEQDKQIKEQEEKYYEYRRLLEEAIEENQKVLQEVRDVISGRKATESSVKYLVGLNLTYNNKIKCSNCYGSTSGNGVFVKYEDECYILSNYHVLMRDRLIPRYFFSELTQEPKETKESKETKETKESKEYYEIENLTFTDIYYQYHVYDRTNGKNHFKTLTFGQGLGDAFDVAAINISCSDSPSFLHIPNDLDLNPLIINKKLHGTTIIVNPRERREEIPYSYDCYLMSEIQGRNERGQLYSTYLSQFGSTDCRGVPGFSGTGLFNVFGKLVGLHVGGSSSSQESLIDQEYHFMKMFLAVNNNTLSDREIYSEFDKHLQQSIIAEARNPSTNIVLSRVIEKLFTSQGNLTKTDLFQDEPTMLA